MIALAQDPLAPTPEGRPRYPPDGFSIDGEPCTCERCPEPCDGSCGCAACYDAHEHDPSQEHTP
jgi:hypothetical protein